MDSGISKNGEKKENYTPGIEILANQTIVGEGSRGSIAEKLMDKFNLR